MNITREQARRYLLNYHRLTDAFPLSTDQIPQYVRKVGCIQFDPLNVVGRNPDLVMQARCPGYVKGGIDKIIYENRRLFDVWDKNMSICAVEDWPFLTAARKYVLPWYEKFRPAIERIAAHLKTHEYACSSDFPLDEKVAWYWGKQRLAKAALECMCYAGTAVVHHKKGNRRYYCLAENFIPREYYSRENPHLTHEDYCRWQVKRRINAIGLLWNRGGDGWLGTINFKSSDRNLGFRSLLSNKEIREIKIEGLKEPLYAAAENLELLDASKYPPEKSMRILAPLDNLIWERKLTEALFGFHYRWEVYTPPAKRKYGYYVLPLLWGDGFAGRLEMEAGGAVLAVKSLWWENGSTASPSRSRALEACLRRFARYNGCENTQIRTSL